MRLVIFDLDGTLIDSAAMFLETTRAAFETIGEPVPSESAMRSISGISALEAMAILAPGVAEARVNEILASYRRHYRLRAGVVRQPLFAGALDAVDLLWSQPGSVLAVATGKGYRGAIELLEAHGLLDRFDSVQTPDHNRGKPDPQMIETAMAHAGAGTTRTVMIGDTVHDMHMARAAGIAAIGVAWGYHAVAELENAGADAIVGAYADLVPAIDSLVP